MFSCLFFMINFDFFDEFVMVVAGWLLLLLFFLVRDINLEKLSNLFEVI